MCLAQPQMQLNLGCWGPFSVFSWRRRRKSEADKSCRANLPAVRLQGQAWDKTWLQIRLETPAAEPRAATKGGEILEPDRKWKEEALRLRDWGSPHKINYTDVAISRTWWHFARLRRTSRLDCVCVHVMCQQARLQVDISLSSWVAWKRKPEILIFFKLWTQKTLSVALPLQSGGLFLC